jgi:DNA mismatch repair protein MutS
MIIDDYLNYLDEYIIKYGDNTIIFMQVGSFFELYSIDENSKYLYNISDICNIQISKKNKNIKEISRNNPLMCGFPLYVVNKYVQLLLQKKYTIVLIEQITEPPEPKRKITEIISPSTNININSKNSNYIMVLYYEEIDNNLLIGISGVDLTTGRNFVYENSSSKSDPQFTLDETYRLIINYNPSEILIISDKINEETKKKILNMININCLIHKKWNDYELLNYIKKVDYQNNILKKSFTNNSMLSIIELIHLEKFQLGLISFCSLLQFAYEHNNEIIKDLKYPEIINNNCNLSIEYNSALQLNIISYNDNEKPLLEILNRCNTAFGSRVFKDRLLNPINDKNILLDRYNNIENYLKDDKYKNINKYLSNINDLERIKRKIILKKINPCEWGNIVNSIENSLVIFKLLNNDDLINNINNIINNYKILNIDECSKYNINDIKTNIFNNGIYKDLDELNNDYENNYQKIIEIINKISNLGDTNCKNDYNDNDGFYITITKKRFETAEKINKSLMNSFDKKLLNTNNSYKLTSTEIKTFSNSIRNIQNDINSITIEKYYEYLSNFIKNTNDDFDIIIKNLIDIDITCCNAKNAYDFKYYKPNIDLNSDNSYINADNLRHPIIENLITDIEYIGNDIQLNQNGILLYGINSSGKSSLMKAIGLSIIMAQAGMFVPSINFNYSPYNHIMTRICGNDNIYKGMSSFIVEMTELRNIIQRADKNSLIIGDEVCSGTEPISGISIISSTINELIEKKSSFIFTSHLHDLTSISLLKNREKLKIYHIHISVINNKIIYERKLKEGQGCNFYGIEVCKSLDLPLNFILNAEKIKKELLGINNNLIDIKKSSYNSSIFMDICSVCKINKSIDTHHINYQSLSDDNGFFDNYHKNIKHNLIPICKECHDKEHNGIINIQGFKQTSNGIELEINNNDKLKIYIKKGKNNWFSRRANNHKFKLSNEKEILNIINRITKSKYKEIPEYIYLSCFDPSL